MNRILIIRPSAIGDIVMASPMLAVLRQAYPESYIAWIAEPHLGELLASNPDLDEVIAWPKGEWKRLLRERKFGRLAGELKDFSRKLRRRNFDIALDTVGLLKSRLLARLSGAPVRIGFESKEPGAFLMTQILSRGEDNSRMSSEYRHLMDSLGLDAGDFAPRLVLSEEGEVAAAEVLKETGIEGGFVAIAPFTTRPQKHWFESRWSEMALEAERAFGLPVVVLGGPGDREAMARLQQASEGRIRIPARPTSLTESAALVKKCSLLVGVDSGLTHMGTAFRRPTVALFGATCPYTETASPLTRVLYVPYPCSPCRRSPSCDERFDCMDALSVEQVMTAAKDLLEEAA